MATNRPAGSGPTMMGGGGDGPAPGLSGTLGVAPQAAPQQGALPAQNMLAQGGQAPPGGMPPPQGSQAPALPPSKEKLMDVLQKEHFVMATLKALLSKPDLAKKDVLNAVGEIVADGVLSPFDAAKYLADFPNDTEPLTLRQWVGTHYANVRKDYQTVSSMLEAHGQMMRRLGRTQMPPQMAQSPGPINQLSAAQ
jgi:hypothetical protein